MSNTVTRKKHVDLARFTATAGSLTVEEAAAAVQGKATPNAPVDTGTLRNSIGRRVIRDDLAEVFATAEYAVYQEFGTRFMSAQPFMRPALDEFKSQLAATWRKTTRKAYASNKR